MANTSGGGGSSLEPMGAAGGVVVPGSNEGSAMSTNAGNASNSRVSLGSSSSSNMVALMEGVLSKWTNVMKGWQFRWFVLDENTGLLSYYTVCALLSF